MTAGRKTLYEERFDNMAELACKEGGFTDHKLGKLFSVTRITILNWKRDFPSFAAALQRGKDEFDSDKVEKALQRRATGFSYNETVHEAVTIVDPITGLDLRVMVPTKITRKTVAPDTGAAGIWLFNRRPHRWRNKQIHEVSGPNGGPVEVKSTEGMTVPQIMEELKKRGLPVPETN